MSGHAGAEGRIHIQLDCRPIQPIQPGQAKVANQFQVRLRSSRPVLACRVFEQRSVEQALALVPMLFSVCGRAQSVAAVRAVESALAKPAATEVEAHRDTLVALESIREHLWRVLIDWPQLTGAASRTDLLAPINQALNALMAELAPAHGLSVTPGLQQPLVSGDTLRPQWRSLRAQITHCVFAGDLERWLDSDRNADHLPRLPDAQHATPDLWGWLHRRDWLALGDVGLRPLPSLPADALAQRFAAADCDQWVAQPEWQDQPYESGPLARHSGHPRIVACRQRWGYGLGTRLTARLVALAGLLHEVDHQLDGDVARRPLSGPRGLAQLETSRGRLVHHVEVTAAVITRYRILAPTEWNFHPQGIAAQALGHLNNDQPVTIIEQQARWLLQAIDPCVAVELDIQPTSTTGRKAPTTRDTSHA